MVLSPSPASLRHAAGPQRPAAGTSEHTNTISYFIYELNHCLLLTLTCLPRESSHLHTHPSCIAAVPLAPAVVLCSDFPRVIKPESRVYKFRNPPFVCIFNGSRFRVSQGGCGGVSGTFLGGTAGQGLFIFVHPAVPEEPPPLHRPQPGVFTLGVDWEWILGGCSQMLDINVQHLGCWLLLGGVTPPITPPVDPHPDHLLCLHCLDEWEV